ncbi:intraflagellar transport protein 122 [Chloropicon roscoffensis]|uniref:Intraflagellar transport protein 122 homolog n=1 Tax=Chloropicon roscoffensis TaxID=1461544 RepID=A0AAX4PJN0_9CHLO
MRATLTWSDSVPERDDIRNVCYNLAFNPEGTQLVAGVGTRVLVYDAMDGDLLHSLKGHKDSVYCIAYANDGKRFASGSADKNVIIWTSKAEGILKYSHDDSIQALSYNPVTQQLASATASDFGLWSPEQKSVTKQKVNSKVLCLAWTNDGQYLALGHYNGNISIRDKAGMEKVLIEKSAQVWCLSWNPSRYETYDVLAVGCFNGTVSFYQLSGAQLGKEVKLGYDPLSLSYSSDGEFLNVGGTNRKVQLYSKDGTFLGATTEMDSWIWCAKPRPKHNYLAMGCEDGTVAVHQISFSTVHGLYRDRYAYRENMTDVVVQNLLSEQKVRIKCRDCVKLIAMYKNRLAVQLTDRVIIYEVENARDSGNMSYRVFTKIPQKLDCNLLVVTSHHFLLCLEKKLQIYTFHGVKEREWNLDSVIRYIKVIGGPRRRESILVGLKNGLVQKIFINNPFPVELVKHPVGVRCLDLSASRHKLAVVDENAKIYVYNLKGSFVKNSATGDKQMLMEAQELFLDEGATSVAWNSDFEDMLCYTGRNTLNIKTGDFPVHSQKLSGFVVGFMSSKIFCLHYQTMETIDVPQSASMNRYLEIGDYKRAYEVACLGVSEEDWKHLGMQALQENQVETARNAFVRICDIKSISLLSHVEQELVSSACDLEVAKKLVRAKILAFQGNYQGAARMYAECNRVDCAMEMFSDLRQFEEAKQWAEQYSHNKEAQVESVREVIQRQAQWSEEVNDFEAAGEMYMKAKNYEKAAGLFIHQNLNNRLIEIVRILPSSVGSHKLLNTIAAHFAKSCEVGRSKAIKVSVGDKKGLSDADAVSFSYAKEVFVKLGDLSSLVELCIKHAKWDDAISVAKQENSKPMISKVYISHARWLAENDQFEAARKSYLLAGRPDEATHMMEQMCHNAISEDRYLDASFYFYKLAMDTAMIYEEEASSGRRPGHEDVRRGFQKKFDRFYQLAEVCYAYHYVLQSVREPFTEALPSVLYNMACFLVLKVVSKEPQAKPLIDPPRGMSTVTILQCLAKYAEQMGAYNLARFVYNRLGSLNMCNPKHQEHNDLLSLAVRAKPFKDREALLPVCFVCGAQNSSVGSRQSATAEDRCHSCGAKFERSFATFEYLPVVEFQLAPGIDEREAIQLVKEAGDPEGAGEGEMEASMAPHQVDYDHRQGGAFGGGGAAAEVEDGQQVLSLDADAEEDTRLVDQQLRGGAGSGLQGAPGMPPAQFAMGRGDLRRLHASEVIVHQWPGRIHDTKFFRVLDPDAQVMLGECGHFYEQDEYEMFVLEKGVAPFCQTPLEQSSAEKFGLGFVSGLVDLEGEAEAEDLGSDGRASAEVGRPKSARGRGGSKKRSSKKVEAAAALVAHSLENQANMRPANRMESQFGSVVMKPTPMVGHIPPRPQSRGVQR